MISLKEKKIKLDFIYLFLGVFIFNLIYLYIINTIYKRPFVVEDDFSKLNNGVLTMYVLVIPLIEEFCFRGILDLSKNLLFVSIAISIVVLSLFEFNSFSIIAVTPIFLIGVSSLFNSSIIYQIKVFVDKYVIIVIIITSILFSIIHLSNYDDLNAEAWLKILPKLIGGLYFGYIAYKYGIIRSCFLHSANNLIPFIMIFVIKYLEL